jgi:hypothetical protein
MLVLAVNVGGPELDSSETSGLCGESSPVGVLSPIAVSSSFNDLHADNSFSKLCLRAFSVMSVSKIGYTRAPDLFRLIVVAFADSTVVGVVNKIE